MATLEKLTKRFEDPINVYGRIYYLRDYMSIEKIDTDNTFQIFYFQQVPNEYIKARIAYYLLKILIDINIVPNEIQYLLPCGTLATKHVPFTISFQKNDRLVTKITADYIIGDIPTESYLKVYELRYNKIPFLKYSEKIQRLEMKHSWIWRIVFQ